MDNVTAAREANLPEESSKQARGKVARDPSRKRAISKPTRLTEPITPRKGQRIRDREDERDAYTTSQSTASQKKRGGRGESVPTKLSQITFCNLTIANIASPIHSAGVAYRLSQKKRLSVALMVRVFGSELSKTQCDSPEEVLTSFHQRRPTRRRPAMFLR